MPLGWAGTKLASMTVQDPASGLISYDPSEESWTTGDPAPCPVDDSSYRQVAWFGASWVNPCGSGQLQINDRRVHLHPTVGSA